MNLQKNFLSRNLKRRKSPLAVATRGAHAPAKGCGAERVANVLAAILVQNLPLSDFGDGAILSSID